MNICITGASRGIGRSVAEALISAGHEVIGLARTPSSGKIRILPCDVSQWESVQNAAHEVGALWNNIDALIHCAGTQGAVGEAMSLDSLAWSETIRANLDGTFYTIRGFFPLLEKSKQRAKVICFSGGGSTSPRPNFSAYGVAKSGVVRLVETLAEEWKGKSIDINSVAPGAIRTQMTEEVVHLGPHVVGEKEFAQANKVLETGGGSLEKVNDLVRFLLSDQSDGISGRLFAAQWDSWDQISNRKKEFLESEAYTLRRVVLKEWS